MIEAKNEFYRHADGGLRQLENKNAAKLLYIMLILITIFMGRKYIVGREEFSDNLDSEEQGIMRTEESTICTVLDEDMKNQTGTPLTENNDKKPQQRIPTGNRYFDEAEAYRMVLAEHEYVIKSGIESYEYDEWENVEDLVFYSGKRDGILFYCLKDLSNDSHPELIIGHFLENEDTYWLDVIYQYSEEKGIVWSVLSEGMPVHLYDGGIIEMEGPGVYCPLLYYRFLPDESGGVEYLGCYTIEEWEDGTIKYFKRLASEDRRTEISEKEYKEIIGTYTAVPINLDYLPIEGFCKEH